MLLMKMMVMMLVMVQLMRMIIGGVAIGIWSHLSNRQATNWLVPRTTHGHRTVPARSSWTVPWPGPTCRAAADHPGRSIAWCHRIVVAVDARYHCCLVQRWP
ncbi:hypothetical protein PUN28_010807 [Cardiocondyla obscurior]|uniref:Secreted protein n=1 Tax=Cardiocondyla obscurior TaxID=286306 RepID=A0AAW2FK39_9HYME